MKYFLLNLLLMVGATSFAAELTLSLEQCRQMALATDENIRISENRVLESQLELGVARTQYLPKFAGSANVMYTAPDNEFMGMKMLMRGAYMAGINLQQPVYAGGKITAGKRMAAVGVKISEEQLDAMRMDVIAEAEKSYWTYVAVLSKVEMMESYLAMMDSIYAMTADAVEIGLQPRQTLMRVNTRRSEIVYHLNQARAGADLCRLALSRVIGVDDSTEIRLTEFSTDDSQLPMLSTDLSERPEARILSQLIDLKRHEMALTRGDFLPTMGVQLGWSAYGNMKMKGWTQDQTGNPVPMSMNYSNNGFMGVLSLQIPLFHWGEGMKKVKKAKLEVENARLSREKNLRLMELEVRQAYSNLQTGHELVMSARIAMDEADMNLRQMKEQYEVGLITLTDLLEAQSQWHSSSSNLIEARTQLRINRITYLRALGQI